MDVYENLKTKQDSYEQILLECSNILGEKELQEEYQLRLMTAWEQLQQAENDVELTNLEFEDFEV